MTLSTFDMGRISQYGSQARWAPASERPRRWQDDARCKDVDVSVFFPPPSGVAGYDAARVICTSCPVRQECLDFAIRNNIPEGFYGGMTPRERGNVRSKRRPRPLACQTCGTGFAGEARTLHCSDDCRNWSRSMLARRS